MCTFGREKAVFVAENGQLEPRVLSNEVRECPRDSPDGEERLGREIMQDLDFEEKCQLSP